MTREESADWDRYRSMRVIDPDAAERGRLLAAHQMMNDPEARGRVEDVFGIEYCRQMYPEVYRDTGRPGLAKVMDRFRNITPW